MDNISPDLAGKYSQLYRNIISQVGSADIFEGKKRYSGQTYKENGLLWKPEDYSHKGFRAIYSQRLFHARSDMVFNVLKFCESREYLPNFFLDPQGMPKTLTVASFGCGPGSDLAGFEASYDSMKLCRLKWLESQPAGEVEAQLESIREKSRLESATGYDREPGWRLYMETLGYSFQEQFIDEKFLQEIPPVDVAILCYFAHSALFSQPIQPMEYVPIMGRYPGDPEYDAKRNWDILMEKCNLILVVDTIRQAELRTNLLGMRGFIPLDDFVDINKRRVGVNIWCKDWSLP